MGPGRTVDGVIHHRVFWFEVCLLHRHMCMCFCILGGLRAPAVTMLPGRHVPGSSGGRGWATRVQRLEPDVILMEKALIVPNPLQKLPLSEPTAARAWSERVGRNALHLGAEASCTGESAITLDLALLTQHARKHPRRLWGGCLLRLCGRVCRRRWHVVMCAITVPGGCRAMGLSRAFEWSG